MPGLSSCAEVWTFNVDDYARKLEVPTLVVHGEQSGGGPKDPARPCADRGNQHEPALLDNVLDEGWIDMPAEPGQGKGRAGMKGAMAGYYATFPDIHVVNEDFVAQDGKVLVRSTIHATQRGSFAGVPASGRAISIMAMDLHEICHGKVVQT